MHLYAYQRARCGDDETKTALAEKIGVTRETVSRWGLVPGFNEWLEGAVSVYRTPIHERLEQVALENLTDFRFWETMATKYGFIEKKESQVPMGALPMQAPTKEAILEVVRAIKDEQKGKTG
jgi:hypothetical protein